MEDSNAAQRPSRQLMGVYELVFDKKGRILLPQTIRDRLGPDFAIYVGAEGRLCIAPNNLLAEVQASLLSGDDRAGNPERLRLILGSAETNLNTDSSGRVVVPMRLRQFANLSQELVLVGMGGWAEVWSSQDHYHQAQMASTSNLG